MLLSIYCIDRVRSFLEQFDPDRSGRATICFSYDLIDCRDLVAGLADGRSAAICVLSDMEFPDQRNRKKTHHLHQRCRCQSDGWTIWMHKSLKRSIDDNSVLLSDNSLSPPGFPWFCLEWGLLEDIHPTYHHSA